MCTYCRRTAVWLFSLAGNWSRAPGSSGTDYMDVMIRGSDTMAACPVAHCTGSGPQAPKPQPPTPYCEYFVSAGPSSLPDEVSVIF